MPRILHPTLVESGMHTDSIDHDDEDSSSASLRSSRRPARRSVWALAALAAGFLLARELQTPESWPFFVACAGLAVASALWRRAQTAPRLLLLAMLCFGAGWFTLRIHQSPTSTAQLSGGLGDSGRPAKDPVPVAMHGVIVEPPAGLDPPPSAALAEFYRVQPTASFTISLRHGPDGADEDRNARARELPRQGLVRVRVSHPELPITDADGRSLLAGDLVRVEGLFRPIRRPMNPGEIDRRARAAQDGVLGFLHTPSVALISTLEDQPLRWPDRALAPVRRAVWGLRAHAHASLASALDEPASQSTPDRSDDPLLDRAFSERGERGEADSPAPSERSDRPASSTADARRKDQHRQQGRALLAAMLLGARDEHLPQITDAFTRLGLTHLVAISGFNMVVLAGLVLFVVRLTGDHGGWESLIACAAIGLYLIVLPVEAPSLRGGLMVMSFIAAEAAGRRYDRLTVLGWLAIALALLRPLDVFSPGYQLTFGIVAALLVLSPRVMDRLFVPTLRGVQRPALPVGRSPEARAQRWGMRLRQSMSAFTRSSKLAVASALTAWAVATPIVLHHTGMLSTLAPITTLIVGPLCSMFIGVGYAVLLVGAVWPSGTGALGPILDTMGLGLVRLVYSLDAVPGATVRLPPISAVLAFALLAMAVWWLLRGRLRDPVTLALTAACGVWLAVELVPARGLPDSTPLRIDALAVGDGTCLLIRSADRAALWDCGSLNPYLGSRTIPEALRTLGVTRLDEVFITHANLDHFASLADVARSVPVGRVITTDAFMRSAREGQDPAAPGWKRATAAFHTRMTAPGLAVPFETLSAGQQLQFGHARMHVLWPDERAITELDPPPRRIDPNDLSLVVRLDVPVLLGDAGVSPGAAPDRTRSVLLTGDATRLALPLLLERHASNEASRHELRAEVLELPHHGSFNEPAAELVRRANPSIVLQSTGPRRASDPRWRDAAPAFFSGDVPELSGRAWLTTAERGWSAVIIDRDGTLRTRSMHKP